MSATGFLKRQGGYTSRIGDLGIQWDTSAPNLGRHRYRAPQFALKPDPAPWHCWDWFCEEQHHFIPGDDIWVCTKCGYIVPKNPMAPT